MLSQMIALLVRAEEIAMDVASLSPISALIPPATIALTSGLTWAAKRSGFYEKDWFQRALPLAPHVVALGLTFIPGLGMEGAPIGLRIGFAFGSGASAGWTHKFVKQTIRGEV